MKTYIGIDPGQNGGIAFVRPDGTEVFKMPPTYADIFDFLAGKMVSVGNNAVCILEDVGHGMPGQSSSATAKFAEHIGGLKMALYALGVRTELVKPQKWQKTFGNTVGASKACATKVEWKNKLKLEAQRLFPGVSVTLWGADALLLAEYGRRSQL